MSSIGSVTDLLGRLKGGEGDAARPLWEAYYRRMVGLARARLRGAPRAAADEEDVAQSAFKSFCRAAEEGRFPRLDDRDDLWQVVALLVRRKAADLREREGCQKRGGGRVQNASALEENSSQEGGGLAGVPAEGPGPAEEAQDAEECRRLLGMLGDEELVLVAVWKLEGHTNVEIAGLLNRSVGAVERKLQLIRRIWADEVSDSGEKG